jgi:DNA polymerase-3 subunit delta'
VGQGIHPDIRIVGVGTGDDDGANRRDIRIEQVRELEAFLNLTPYEGACKVVVIDGAEQMNTAASNALLKTLEEPPDDSLLLLVTSNEDALLPTIRSRCSALYLKPVPKAVLEERLASDYAADPETAERVARLSRGCFGQAVNSLRDSQAREERNADLNRLQQICEGGMDLRFDYAAEIAAQFGRDREAARDLLYLWLRWWRDLMLVKEGGEEYLYNADLANALRVQASQLSTSDVVTFIKRINRTLEALDANANPRLTLEALVLGLPRVES